MHINKFKKIVIKIGSSILVDYDGKPKKNGKPKAKPKMVSPKPSAKWKGVGRPLARRPPPRRPAAPLPPPIQRDKRHAVGLHPHNRWFYYEGGERWNIRHAHN